MQEAIPRESKPSWFETAAKMAASIVTQRKEGEAKMEVIASLSLYEQAVKRITRAKEILMDQVTKAQINVKQKLAEDCDAYGRNQYEKAHEIAGYTKQASQEAIGTAIYQVLMAIKMIRRTEADEISGREEEGGHERPRITGKSEHIEEGALEVLKKGLDMAITLENAATPKTTEEWTRTCEAMLADKPIPNPARENERNTMVYAVEKL